VITGIGSWTALGPTWPDLRRSALEGRSGLRPLGKRSPELADAVAGLIDDLKPFRARFPDIRPPLPIPLTRIALVSAFEALSDAGLVDADDRGRFGVILGRATGPASVVVKTLTPVIQRGPKKASPLLFSQSVSNAPLGAVATRFGLRGPNLLVQSGAALMLAFDALRRGDAPVILCGGMDEVEERSFAASAANGFIAPSVPAEAICPYDPACAGPTHGEGAAFLALERADHARARGARIYAELSAVTVGDEPGLSDMSQLRGWGSPTGEGLAQLCREALAQAGTTANAIVLHSGSGNGEARIDRAELAALALLGRDDLRPFSLKGLTGDTRGAGPVLCTAWAAAWAQEEKSAQALALITHIEFHGGELAAVLRPWTEDQR